MAIGVQRISGGETGDFNEVTTTGGTCSVQTGTVINGVYSYRTNPTTTAVGWFSITTAAVDDAYVRFNFQYATIPDTNNEEIFGCGDGTTQFIVRITSAGKLRCYSNTTALDAAGATVLSVNTPYRIEVRKQKGTSGVWEVKINGTLEQTFTQNHNVASTVFNFGKRTNRNGKTVDFFYDDIVIADAGYPGPGQCARGIPTGNGHYTGWAASTGTKYGCIDEAPNNWADYIDSSTVDAMYSATITASTVTGDILAVQVSGLISYISEYCSPYEAALLVRSATVDSVSANVTILSASAQIYVLEVDPATSAAWTASAVQAAEVGVVARRACQTICSQLSLMVDFNDTPAVVKPRSLLTLGCGA